MAVIAVSTFRTAPGGLYLALNLLREGVKVFENLGVRTTLASLVRGGVPGELALFLEYPDFAAYGETMERSYSDESMSSFMRRAQDVDALLPVDARDWLELPGLAAEAGALDQAKVITVSVAKVQDHGSHQQPSPYRQWHGHMATAGIPSRVVGAMHSDPAGLTAAMAYYPDFLTLGSTMAKLHTDPDYSAFLHDMRADESRWNPLRNTIYRVV